ncbi:MAG: AI-2E family transporter [Candidatus Cybelea sp.]
MQTTLGVDVWRRVAWIAGAIVLLIVAVLIIRRIPKTIAIFVIAAFIAFGVQPVSRRLERYMPKPLAISLVFLALFIVVALFFVIVVPLTINQTQLLAANIPTYATLTQNWLQTIENSLAQHFPTLHLPTAGFNVGKITGAQLSAWVSLAAASFGAIAVNTATGFFIAFSAIILSFFFLLNDSQIAEGFASMFPPSRRETARNLSAEVTELFGHYISGQVLVCAITGTVIAIASAIIGFKLSLIVGIVSGVAYAIPIVGMLIAQIIAIPMSAPQGLWMVIWVQIIIFGMARISDNVLVPKIMGKSVGVSPIGSMFAVFAGGELFGVPGLILGIPVAALIKILWRYFMAPWIAARQAKG